MNGSFKDKAICPHKILQTDREVANLWKAFGNNLSAFYL